MYSDKTMLFGSNSFCQITDYYRFCANRQGNKLESGDESLKMLRLLSELLKRTLPNLSSSHACKTMTSVCRFAYRS